MMEHIQNEKNNTKILLAICARSGDKMKMYRFGEC